MYWDRHRKQHGPPAVESGSSTPRSSQDNAVDGDTSSNEQQEDPLAAFKRFLHEHAEQATQPHHDPYKIKSREDGTFMVLDTQVPFAKIAYK
jgi:hypothetical protein